MSRSSPVLSLAGAGGSSGRDGPVSMPVTACAAGVASPGVSGTGSPVSSGAAPNPVTGMSMTGMSLELSSMAGTPPSPSTSSLAAPLAAPAASSAGSLWILSPNPADRSMPASGSFGASNRVSSVAGVSDGSAAGPASSSARRRNSSNLAAMAVTGNGMAPSASARSGRASGPAASLCRTASIGAPSTADRCASS